MTEKQQQEQNGQKGTEQEPEVPERDWQAEAERWREAALAWQDTAQYWQEAYAEAEQLKISVFLAKREASRAEHLSREARQAEKRAMGSPGCKNPQSFDEMLSRFEA